MMKTIKRVDLAIQVALLVGAAITLASTYLELGLPAYFIVRAYQIVSQSIHIVNKWNVRNGTVRYYFNFLSCVEVLCILLLVIVPDPLAFLYVLIFIAPIMLAWYALICFHEVMHYAKRPLELI